VGEQKSIQLYIPQRAEFENRCSNKNFYPDGNKHRGSIHNSQKVETPKCPSTDEWINRMWYMPRVGYSSPIKRNEVLIHSTTWTNLENIMQVREASHKGHPIV